jgi:murein DD-endopeptidase MepM/ murein hydrolase activator NlpD
MLGVTGEYILGINLFAYCNNNPVNHYDPDGHFFIKKIRNYIKFIIHHLNKQTAIQKAREEQEKKMIELQQMQNKRVWPTGKEKVIKDYPTYEGSKVKHEGTDFPAKSGTPIVASMGGKVIKVVNKFPNNANKRTNSEYADMSAAGNYVIIENYFGAKMYYCHMQQDIVVRIGDVVKAGDLIGYVGNTGNSSGAHLHFAVKVNNVYVHPKDYLPEI